jgi:hypothetical protein
MDAGQERAMIGQRDDFPAENREVLRAGQAAAVIVCGDGGSFDLGKTALCENR